jgi:N utilization substance protein A
VENAMAAMSGPGTPLAVLTEHGLEAELVDKLVEAEITTVERLADMTPEELEAIPEIGEAMVEKIQVAVNGFYLQFEAAAQQAVFAPVVPQRGTETPVEADEAEAESTQAAGPVKPPMTMPGLPVEGAESDDEDDDDDFSDDEDEDDEAGYDDDGEADLEDSATIDGEEAEEVLAGSAELSAAEGEPHPASAGETGSEDSTTTELDDDGIDQQEKE